MRQAACGFGWKPIVVASLLLTGVAHAETIVEPYGGTGGNPTRVDCEPGSYVVGFRGRAGGWIDQMSIVCARWNDGTQSLQSASQAKVSTPLGDSTGGDAIAESCPDGYAIHSMAVRTTLEEGNSSINVRNYHAKFVHAVRFACQPAMAGSGQVASGTFGSWSPGPNGRTLTFWGPWSCPPRELATGIHGRSGNFVDAIGLVCGLRPEPAAVGVATKPVGDIAIKKAPEGPIAMGRLNNGAIVGGQGGGVDIPAGSPSGSPAPSTRSGSAVITKPGPVGPIMVPPEQAWQNAAPLVCRGGGKMPATIAYGTGETTFSFQRAPAGFATRPPGEGECAWLDRPVSPYEPDVLHVPIMGPGVEKARAVVEAAKSGGSWQVHAYYDSGNRWLETRDVTALNLLPPIAEAPAPPTPPSPPTQPGNAACGTAGGTAVVVIADPRLTTLNVRTAPGGAVLGTVPEGVQVSIVGPCGPVGSAGIVAPGQQSPSSGWCQIDRPVSGCVSAQFLQFGASGAAGIAKAIAPLTSGFGGEWSSAVDNVAHQISLRQAGDQVTGSFTGADGSQGQISGKLKGNVLQFSWMQTDGTQGTGKFTLSKDGRSFVGSYSYGKKPSQVTGSWNGSRP